MLKTTFSTKSMCLIQTADTLGYYEGVWRCFHFSITLSSYILKKVIWRFREQFSKLFFRKSIVHTKPWILLPYWRILIHTWKRGVFLILINGKSEIRLTPKVLNNALACYLPVNVSIGIYLLQIYLILQRDLLKWLQFHCRVHQVTLVKSYPSPVCKK